jgi:dolichol-phosphate mannosyltransferase
MVLASTVSFGVIIPMYNEEPNAERCVRAVLQTLAALPHRSGVIVVDDGSSDRTGEILEGLRRERAALSVERHAHNCGYGRALQTGVARARAEGFAYALFMDSDLTNDPKYIPAFVDRMLENVDVIKGSRYVAGGGMVGVPLHRTAVSIVGNKIAGWLLGVPVADCTNGFRAVKVDLLAKMRLTEPGFSVIMQELYFARFMGASFCEVPHTLTSRTAELRASAFRYRPRVFAQYLKYPIRACLGIRPTEA